MFSTFSRILAVGFLSVLTAPCIAAPASDPNKVITTLPYQFTLAAFNLTLPNANGTGAPLVIAPLSAVTGEEFQVSAVRYHYHF
jgi:hypothetical protein